MLYEINYLVLQSKTGELEKIRKDIKTLIESFESKITSEKEYLKRKLSYEINHEQYGFFTVLRFETKNPEKLQEIKKALNLDKTVDRYIIVRAEELPSLEEQAEKEVERKSTLKQGEVEKAFAEETKKTAGESQVTNAVEEEPASKKETDPEQETEKKDPEEGFSTESEEKEEVEPQRENTGDANADENEPEKEKPAKKKDEKEKVSLDDLDKKLDEILDL